jgi:hypothetical protein
MVVCEENEQLSTFIRNGRRLAPPVLLGDLLPTGHEFTKARRIYPSTILEAVLKDQLDIDEPEKGPIYVFIQFTPGAIYEDIVNDARQ